MARSTAISSILLLVVAGSPPLSKWSAEDAHAHPPGPGFPLHAPSVYTRNRSSPPIGQVCRNERGIGSERSEARAEAGCKRRSAGPQWVHGHR